MSENIQRGQGRGSSYKFDRGGVPAEFGPFIGVVKKNVDPTRSGVMWVYIEAFSGGDESDEALWRKVRYAPPFYGVTPPSGTADGPGTFPGNQLSYGMWFTPPDLGTKVICFFVDGDKDQGYYLGCVIDPGMTHMVPAIGASTEYVLEDGPQSSYLSSATQLPVTEINSLDQEIAENPRFFDQSKPVQSYVAGIMMQQGLLDDPVRGPIRSNAQRESPSNVFGIATPGRAIYQGGLSEVDIQERLNSGQLLPQDVKVIGRRGGHTLVLDDGDLQGKDNLVRIRTAKGHQITMSDDGDCFYITHANGQTWIELGKQGTVDVFSTNSVNVRTQGTINLHADKDINLFAGGSFNVKAAEIKQEADANFSILAQQQLSLYSKNLVGIKSDGTIALKSQQLGSWDAGQALVFEADCIKLNGGGATVPVQTPTSFFDYRMADTAFLPDVGWTVQQNTLKTICTRAPTHEPYPYHNQGVETFSNLGGTESILPFSAGVEAALGSLSSVALGNPLSVDSLLTAASAEFAVGPFSLTETTALMAQSSTLVDQALDAVDPIKGIGKFGFNPQQLESFGFLKPGSVATFVSGNPTDAGSFDWLESPSVWTGRDGVNTLTGLLTNGTLQDRVQNSVLASSLEGLKAAGVCTGQESPTGLAALVQSASKFGVDNTVAWVNGNAPSNIATEIDQWAKGGEYAVNLVQTKLQGLGNNGIPLGGFTGTVNRSVVDQALAQVIGNPKIPVPNFSTGLFTSTPNNELVYQGRDPVVWDSVNNERLRRGLAPLTNPRPEQGFEDYTRGGTPWQG